ncbi:hypothetical protein HKX48_002381 [Thoreauomyces humboldtii]|nr:hypothetical protein HKX48_002381 [Thoreauomyces humboldtii]
MKASIISVPFLLGAAFANPVNLQTRASASLGSWSGVLPLPLSPISGAFLPTGELLFWSGVSPGGWVNTVAADNTDYVITSVKTLAASGAITLLNTKNPEMFCPGIANMYDGSIMVNGGSGPEAAIIFNIATKTFGLTAPMKIGRGYNADVMTTGKKIFTVGGSFERASAGTNGKDGEVFTPGTTPGWTVSNKGLGDIVGGIINKSKSPDPQGIYRSDNHAWLFPYKSAAGDDMILHAGPTNTIWNINTSKGTTVSAGTRGDDPYSMNGNAVQYAPGYVLKVGGATAYGDLPDNTPASVGLATSKAAYLMNLRALPTGGAQTTSKIASMQYPRAFCSSIVMPGGKVFIVGGQTNLHLFLDENGVLTPEIFDPSAKTFTAVSPMKTARNYHSVALLTADGTIVVAGGGATPSSCTKPGTSPCVSDIHFNAEIFTPPYLLTGAARPVIVSVSGTATAFGKYLHFDSSLTVSSSGCGTGCSYELIRLASATHSVMNDQLRIPMAVQRTNGKDVIAILTGDRPFVMPGYYFLFAISPAGVPSVASYVQVDRS